MNLKIKSLLAREFLAEFAGTFILIVFGDASVAQFVLSKGSHGSFFTVNWGYAVAVILGVIVAGGITGGHLNPAVTLSMAVGKKLRWNRVPVYFAAQYLGAFIGAVVVYFVYFDALNYYAGDLRAVTGANATAGIFATYPNDGIRQGIGFLDQIVGTALLLFCVRAIGDERNMKIPQHLAPICVGFVVLNIGICFGFNCGYAINPARDLGPRIFTAIAGYGSDVFTAFDVWFYVPIVATHIGGLIGMFLYDAFIALHWPDPDSFERVDLESDDSQSGRKDDIPMVEKKPV